MAGLSPKPPTKNHAIKLKPPPSWPPATTSQKNPVTTPNSCCPCTPSAGIPATPSPQNPATLSPSPSPKKVDVSPPRGTYVARIPRNQSHFVPPPENAIRYKRLSQQQHSKSRCVFFSLSLLFVFFLLLFAMAAAVFYLVFLRSPNSKSMNYTLDSVSIKSFNLTTIMSPSPPPVSPKFDATFTAANPYSKIGILYLKGGSVQVFYKRVGLFEGALPRFFQPGSNVTVFTAALKGCSAMEMTTSVRDEMAADEDFGQVPLKVYLRAPVKFKVGSAKTWRMYVKVQCDVTVDNLTADSEIVSKNCQYSVRFW